MREEYETPRNTNIARRRGHGWKGIDQGWVTFIKDHIARDKVEASAS